MPGEGELAAGSGRALVVIRSDFEHEAHALRAARKLAELGLETTVLATLGTDPTREREERRGAIRVMRIGPSLPLLRRLYAGLRRRLAAAPELIPEPDSTGEPDVGSGGSAAGPGGHPGPGPVVGLGTIARREVLWRLVRWLTAADFNLRGIGFVLRTRPTIVHCNDYNTMWIGVAARLLVGSGLVYDSREIWADRNLRPEARWWLLLWEALFVRLAHRVVVTSPGHGEVLARRYRIPEPLLVRNIPERPDGPPPRVRDGRGDGRPVVIYSGGLLRHRGLEQSIRAMAQVDRATLRLLGPVSPPYRAELEQLARDAGVEDRLEFAPPVPPTDVLGELAGADVGLCLFQPNCLSHRLVLPNKLFEYAHAGLPVVGSDLPMIARFIEDHALGATADPEDVEAIAAALDSVLDPRRHDDLRAAARRAAEAVSWEREGAVLASAYRDALAHARR